MSDAFDPYHVWLGIPPAEQPPHYYRLLALALFEGSPEVIENAAERQMAHIRRAAHGKRAEESQRLLNEIAAAQRALLDAARRAAYDAELRSKLGAQARGFEQTMEWKPDPTARPPALPPSRTPPPVAAEPGAKWRSSPEKHTPPAAHSPAATAVATPPVRPAPHFVATSPAIVRARQKFPVLLIVALALAALLPVLALVVALAMTSGEPAVATPDGSGPPTSVTDDPPLPSVGEFQPPPVEMTDDGNAHNDDKQSQPNTTPKLPTTAPPGEDERDPFDDKASFGRTSGEPVRKETLTVSASTLLPPIALFRLPAEARTTVDLKQGQIVELKIEGVWRIGQAGDQVRDAGAMVIAVGHIGGPASQFVRGAPEVEFTVQKDGRLFLGIEDLLSFDNAGEMTVEVRVY